MATTLTSPRSGSLRPWWRLALASAVILVSAGAGFVIYSETRRAELDRHAILAEVHDFERIIRRHDEIYARLGGPTTGQPGSLPTVDREGIARDFDRLGHLEDFRISDVQVDVQRDEARATYTISGRSVGSGLRVAEPAPSMGEMSFVRRGGSWYLVGHRFLR